MAREQLHYVPKEGVKWLKPSHNPTSHLIKEISNIRFTLKIKCFKN